MAYFSELRQQWRPLTAAFIGLGTGFSLSMYLTSIMAPNLLREFGWSKSEFALVHSLSILTFAVFPLVGRLADTIGVRMTALIGVVSMPATFVLLSMMNGSIWTYIALFLLQSILCVTTTTTVYSRIVVQYITRARGLGLAIVASAPALTGAIGAPLLNALIEMHGWRAGYIALAIFTGIAGAVALLMMPPERPEAMAKLRTAAGTKRNARADYAEIVRTRAFWIILVALLLCNLPQVMALSQLKLVLLDQGVSAAVAASLVSAFAGGVLVGRFISGLALDRFPARLVSAIGMGIPSLGLFLLASSLDTIPMLTLSVLLFGLSFGAEGDVVGYLVVRTFGVRIYSTVFGLMTAAIAASASIGAAVLSLTLKLSGGFNLFLLIGGTSVAIGGFMFLMLRASDLRGDAIDRREKEAMEAEAAALPA